MDIRQIRYFVAIADAGSFSAAARSLRIAQPALSQHVMALEKEFGTRLLDRSPRGASLTPAGEVFREHALVVLRDLELARDAVSSSGGAIVGRVAIGLPTTVTPVLAMPLVEEAFSLLPGVTLHLVESHTGFLRELMDSGRLDLALLFNIDAGNGLIVDPLIIEEMHLISTSTSQPASPEINFADLYALDMLMANQPHNLRQLLDSSGNLVMGRPPEIKAEIDSLPTLKRMVCAGLGHTILPLATVHEELESGELSVRKIVNPTIERRTGMVRLAHRPQTRAQQAIADMIRSLVAQIIEARKWAGRAPD